jgi:hypothetical protein
MGGGLRCCAGAGLDLEVDLETPLPGDQGITVRADRHRGGDADGDDLLRSVELAVAGHPACVHVADGAIWALALPHDDAVTVLPLVLLVVEAGQAGDQVTRRRGRRWGATRAITRTLGSAGAFATPLVQSDRRADDADGAADLIRPGQGRAEIEAQ